MTNKQTADTIEDHLDNICNDLKKIGIKFESDTLENMRTLSEPTVFLRLDDGRKRGHLDLHTPRDLTEAKIFPRIELISANKKQRQAVLKIEELPRKITRSVETYDPKRDNIISRFGVIVPKNTKFHVKHENTFPTAIAGEMKKRYYYSVTAKIPRSSTHFLIGYDENHLFISMLPRHVTSVADAHLALLPKELWNRKDYLRQGEFFFVPATERQKKLLCTTNKDTHDRLELVKSNGDESDHKAAATIIIDSTSFVSGAIKHSRHKTLFLNGWYRVVNNREVVQRQGRNTDTTTFD